MNRIKEQPVGIVNLIVAAIEAFIAVLASFNFLQITTEQFGVLMVLVVAIGAIVNWFLVRQYTTPLARPEDNDGTPLVRSVPRGDEL